MLTGGGDRDAASTGRTRSLHPHLSPRSHCARCADIGLLATVYASGQSLVNVAITY